MIEIDEIYKQLIEKNRNENKRTMLLLYGAKCHETIPTIVTLNKMNSAADIKMLWCFRNEAQHIRRRQRHNRQQEKLKQKSALGESNYDNFVMAHQVDWCHYGDVNEVLGRTYDVAVMQDFEVLTPNTIAKVTETVRGGGLVFILMHGVSDTLDEIGQMNMDAHKRYKTNAYDFVQCRFNYRFVFSLLNHGASVLADDNYRIAPMSLACLDLHQREERGVSTNDSQQKVAKLSCKHKEISDLIQLCATKDQAKSLVKIVKLLKKEGSGTNFVTIKSGRGRGKSALLGLSIGYCLTTAQYSRICVTSPCQENIGTVMEFVVKSIEALGYKLNETYTKRGGDYLELRNIHTNQNCHVKYVASNYSDDASKFSGFDLLCIDETAAIPLPIVKKLLGSSSASAVLMSSTIHGYEGTGRSLALKLFTEIQPASSNSMGLQIGEVINLELHTPIRYNKGDLVEKWLDEVLCMNCEDSIPDVEAISALVSASTLKNSSDVQMYCINRDVLFSGHPESEKILLSIMSIFVSSHYKNSPNDLQMLADSSSHQLFCLTYNHASSQSQPIILAVVQVALEGGVMDMVAKETVKKSLKPSGDMVAWTVAQQYNDVEFPQLRGLRIVRIAVHPQLQSKGIGSHCLRVITDTLEKLATNPESISEMSRKSKMETLMTENNVQLSQFDQYPDISSFGPLFMNMSSLSSIIQTKIDYISVSFGLTKDLFRFWKRNKFLPVYLRQTKNEITGEHSCIVMKGLSDSKAAVHKQLKYYHEFSRRFSSLLSSAFAQLDTILSLDILNHKQSVDVATEVGPAIITKYHLSALLTVNLDDYNSDLVRLDRYLRGLLDYHAIIDLVSKFAALYFNWRVPSDVTLKLPMMQKLVLLGLGLQHKSVDELVACLTSGMGVATKTSDKSETSVAINSNQVLGNLRECLRGLLKCYKKVLQTPDV